MSEYWIRWNQSSVFSDKYYLESLINDTEGLKIQLIEAYDKKNQVELSFEKNSVRGYKVTDESFWVKTNEKLNSLYGGEFYSKWTFFKVFNSAYQASFSKNTNDKITEQFTHFSLITLHFIIDILAQDEPDIRVTAEDESNLNIAEEGNIQSGVLPDGRIVQLRKYTPDNKPIMEIYNPTTHESIKILYRNDNNSKDNEKIVK